MRDATTTREERSSEWRNTTATAAIGPVFFALAAWLFWGPDLSRPPRMEMVQVSKEQVSSEPLRAAITGPPTIIAGGFQLRCMECHRLFPSRTDTRRTLGQHRHIILDHGLNNRCLNCHDREQRDRFAIHDGTSVAFTDTPRLCAECHGPTFRDWERGMHGRTMGCWSTAMGVQRRLICTECHDPHVPAIASMSPLPPPNTLRMGTPHSTGHDPAPSPLRQWSSGSRQSTAPTHAEQDSH